MKQGVGTEFFRKIADTPSAGNGDQERRRTDCDTIEIKRWTPRFSQIIPLQRLHLSRLRTQDVPARFRDSTARRIALTAQLRESKSTGK
jgi:hypothetical protein